MVSPRVRAAHDLASIGILMAALTLPGIGLLLGLDTTPPVVARRRLAERPAFPGSLASAGSYARRFDTYLSDHLGFRSGLIRLHGTVATLWLKRRPSADLDLMIGRRNWLYYTGDDVVRLLEGRNLFEEADLGAWERCIRERARWLSKRGIRYMVVLAPDKGTIYPEYLPEWVRPSARGTRLDQLMKAVSGIEGAEVVDLRGALLDAKRRSAHPVYDATDTHWNGLGMYAAYAEIIGRLGPWFPGTRPAPMSAFTISWQRRPGGDLAQIAGLEQRLLEDVPRLIPVTPSVVRRADPGPVVAGRRGLSAREPIVTEREGADVRSAVIFRDSFAIDLVPLLAEHFGRAVFLWTYDFDREVIEREQPSLVIQEYAERMLSVLAPANPPQVSGPTPLRAPPG